MTRLLEVSHLVRRFPIILLLVSLLFFFVTALDCFFLCCYWWTLLLLLGASFVLIGVRATRASPLCCEIVICFVCSGRALVPTAFITAEVIGMGFVIDDEILHHFVIMELQEAKHFIVRQRLVALSLEESDLAQLVGAQM